MTPETAANHHSDGMPTSTTAADSSGTSTSSSMPPPAPAPAPAPPAATTKAEALVVEALANMVQQPPPTPVTTARQNDASLTTPGLMDSPPPLLASSRVTAPPPPLATAVTQEMTVPSPAAAVQDTVPQEHQVVADGNQQATTTVCLPVTTTTTTTTSTPQDATVKKRSTAGRATNQPRLPARERQPPKRKSRAHRRKLLTAPLPRPCLTHEPTLRELQSITFSDYVQKIVLGSAVPYEDDSDDGYDSSATTDTEVDEDEDWQKRPMPLAEGIAKVTLPKGFWPTEESSWTKGDRTGRGQAWQSGTPLGDYRIEAPIAQHVRGLAGVYEFSFVDKGPITLAEFRDRADAYRESVVGCAYDVFEDKKKEQEKEQESQDGNASQEEDKVDTGANNETCQEEQKAGKSKAQDTPSAPKPKNVFADEQERLEYLERFFWKRLGPTMPPAWYGADHEGTLFPEDDDATGWSLGQLDSCLHVLPKVPGVTSPYLYAGMWASVFCAHAEDMNLLSINYLHAGAPKIWYAIAPGPDAQRFESLCASSFAGTPSTKGCKEFLRHKRSLLSPKVLLKAGIKYTTAIQRPGDAIITFPAGYHFGFNSGFNIAEATNFGVPEWIPYGWQAQVCLCRPDSVRIDMHRLTDLLADFNEDQRKFRRKRLSWKEWSVQKHAAKRPALPQQAQAPERKTKRAMGNKKNGKHKVAMSDQQKKGEFWIEVAKPISRKSQQKAKSPAPKKETEPEPEQVGRGKRKRKLTAKAAKWERELLRKKAVEEEPPKKPTVVVEEIWHLAKPLPRKMVNIGLRVLSLLPGTIMGYAPKNSWRASAVQDPMSSKASSSRMDVDDDVDNDRGRQRKNVTDDEEEQEEQCFTGQIVEISDNHVRIHIDGLPRSEDVWMDLNENKVYLDGGRWDDEEAAQDHGPGLSLPQLHYWQEMDSKRRCV